jgi:hypothetical protein
MDGGLNLALVKWGGKGSGAGRIGVAGGAGFNSEIGYFYGGPRLAMQIIGDTLGIEGRFDFLPLAHSYSANTVREWRGSGTVVYQTSDDFGLGFGVELRNGSNPILDQAEFQAQLDDDADRIRKQDALRGDYQMTLATISCRWK